MKTIVDLTWTVLRHFTNKINFVPDDAFSFSLIKRYRENPKIKSLEDAEVYAHHHIPLDGEAVLGDATPYQEDVSPHRINPNKVIFLTSTRIKNLGATILPCVFGGEGETDEPSGSRDNSETPSVQSSASSVETDSQATSTNSLMVSPNMAYSKVQKEKRVASGKCNSSRVHTQQGGSLRVEKEQPHPQMIVDGSLTLAPNLAYNKVQRERKIAKSARSTSTHSPVAMKVNTRTDPPRKPTNSVTLMQNLAYNKVRNARSEENLVSTNHQGQFEKNGQDQRSSTKLQSSMEYDYPITRLGRRRFQGLKNMFEQSNSSSSITSSTSTQYRVGSKQ